MNNVSVKMLTSDSGIKVTAVYHVYKEAFCGFKFHILYYCAGKWTTLMNFY